MKKAIRFILNYFKLFLMPFIFIFMIGALIVKGTNKLIKKATV